jgi:hypothetical protein
MSKLTLTLTAGIMLALPAVVSATPIYVEYDARVKSCFCGDSGYSVGDRVSGFLKIDTDLAPPDRFAGEIGPDDQQTANYFLPGGPDFISGMGLPGSVWPEHNEFDVDAVSVTDDDDRFGHQAYAIWDYSNDGRGGSTRFALQMYSDDRVDDFIHGKDLVQSFDTANLKGALKFIGHITHQVVGAVGYGIDLAFDRLSVTPGRCRAS